MGGLFTLIIVAAVFYFIWKNKATETEWGYLGEDSEVNLGDREKFLEIYEARVNVLSIENASLIKEIEKLKIVNTIKPKQAGAWGVFETNDPNFKIYWKGGIRKLTSIILIGKIGTDRNKNFLRMSFLKCGIFATRCGEDFASNLVSSCFDKFTDRFEGELEEKLVLPSSLFLKYLAYVKELQDALETNDIAVLRNFLSENIPLVKEIIRKQLIPQKFESDKGIVFFAQDAKNSDGNLWKDDDFLFKIGIIPKSLADNYDEPEEVKVQFKQFQNLKSVWESLLKDFLEYELKLKELQAREKMKAVGEMFTKVFADLKQRFGEEVIAKWEAELEQERRAASKDSQNKKD